MKVIEMCSKYLCENVRKAVLSCDLENAEEIRLRLNREVKIKYSDREESLSYKINKEDIENILGRLTQYSPYAFKEEINGGYITVESGYRVGITGTVIEDPGEIQNIKNISSMNIRIAREIKGCCRSVLKYIKGNTIIVSPPGAGKTTLLRDLVRIWSNEGRNICVIDERNEISGTYMGVSQLDLGERTDVIVNVSKARGFEMALRAMSPDVIAADEIGGGDDVNAIKSALNCGVNILCTLHSYNEEDIKTKRGIRELVESKVFDTYIFMNKNFSQNRIEKICDRELNIIWQGK
ncbi:MAG: ATPase, T2SS/T4P/T4SS family [Clostridia bacterium]|nr:ATPase, T2SS/T4P/T4SS family [Clostridia bacterium]